MSLKSKSVYHGSPKDVKGKHLKPSRACWTSRDTGRMSCEKDKLIFATADKEIAICFAASLNDFAFHSNPYILVGHKTELKKLNNPGFLMVLDKQSFTNYNKLTNEYTASKKVKIIKKSRIIPKKELIKMGVKIIVIEDNAKLPMTKEALKRILVEEEKK
jgi:hypothetical protein